MTKSTQFKDWYWVRSNLAHALTCVQTNQHSKNIEEAISIYHSILDVFPRDIHPHRWASTQRSLGFVYDERIEGNRVENQEKMIEHLTQSIVVFTKENYPEDWAITKNALAIVYAARSVGDAKENTRIAIGYLKEALMVLTAEDFPDDWQEVSAELDALEKRLLALEEEE